MFKICRVSTVVHILCWCVALHTNTAPSPLDSFRKLEGTWSIQADGKTLDIQMNYQVASKGTIVTEQFGRELSVFAMDGTAVTMTHYCNVGNQPRLRLRPRKCAECLRIRSL